MILIQAIKLPNRWWQKEDPYGRHRHVTSLKGGTSLT